MISNKFPKMKKYEAKFALNMVLAGFEYILESGEDAVCQDLIDENVYLEAFPHVKNRVERYVCSQCEKGEQP